MSKEQEKGASAESTGGASTEYAKPAGSQSTHELHIDGRDLVYTATADWIVLHKREKPRAEVFFVSYVVDSDTPRPLTFVFNGGPGASSVYLHLGAMGPRRAQFTPEGLAPPSPYRLTDNESTWLTFTDLVFIDPVGTGLSRMIPDTSNGEKEKDSSPGTDEESSEYWSITRDLEALGEAISRFLSRYHKWEVPIYVAGESYGGFRTAKLTKLLQQDYGVGLAGAIIISPALEFTLLDSSDYDVLQWLDTFPSMAGAAWVHGRARAAKEKESLTAYMARAAEFAARELLPVLAVGDMFGEQGRQRVLNRAADLLGIDRRVVQAKNGRIAIDWFVKNLLRDEGLHLGLYDASLKVIDPYPDRDGHSGPDPTLHFVERVFAAGINTQLRAVIGLQTEREYELLSLTVNRKWKSDTREHVLQSQVGATDDLRYGMSLNPDMKVYLCHGLFDLVTPYFAAERITHLMKLTPTQRANLTVKHYHGGHMFYTWQTSRSEFAADMNVFYKGE